MICYQITKRSLYTKLIEPKGICTYFNFGAETVESQPRPTENISVAGNQAIRWTDNNSCMEDLWIPNPNGKNTLRISFTTCAEQKPYDKTDFNLFNQFLSTFKFTK